MTCNFHVGQKVVCIDDEQSTSPSHSGLQVGRVYQVTEVTPLMGGHVRLVEATGRYLAFRFRPVVTRKTDISIFKSMLNPSRERADA